MTKTERKVKKKMSDNLLKKKKVDLNGNKKAIEKIKGKRDIAKLTKLIFDHNGNTPVRKGANLKNQNETSVTFSPEIKEPGHDFFSRINNSTLRKILKNNRWSLEFLSNRLSNENIDSEVGKQIWKDLYERIDNEDDCKKLFFLIKKIATIFSLVTKCDHDHSGYLPQNFREGFDVNEINYQALCQDGHGPMVKLYELYDQIGQLKEEKLDIRNFYQEEKLESFEDEEQNLDFLLDQDLDVIDDNINNCEIMALKATKAELYSTLRN